TFGSGAEHAVAAIVLVIGRRALHAYGGLGGDDETAPPSADSLVFAGGLARDLAEAGYGLPVIECRGGAEQVLDHRHYQAHAVLHADLQQVGILQAQAAAVVLVVHQVAVTDCQTCFAITEQVLMIFFVVREHRGAWTDTSDQHEIVDLQGRPLHALVFRELAEHRVHAT